MTQIEQLLTEARNALQQGDFDGLHAISALLETVTLPTDPQHLHRVARMASDNTVALHAAAKGLRAARRRITDLQNAQRLTVYDAGGKRQHATFAPDRTHRL